MSSEFEFGSIYGWGRRSAWADRPLTPRRPAGRGADTARAFLAALAARDFTRLQRQLSADARMRALLPDRVCEQTGAARVAAQFRDWTAGFAEVEMLDSGVREVGDRIHVRWRLRVRATHAGRRQVVEKYADVDASDRIHRIDLLCSFLHDDSPVRGTDTTRSSCP